MHRVLFQVRPLGGTLYPATIKGSFLRPHILERETTKNSAKCLTLMKHYRGYQTFNRANTIAAKLGGYGIDRNGLIEENGTVFQRRGIYSSVSDTLFERLRSPGIANALSEEELNHFHCGNGDFENGDFERGGNRSGILAFQSFEDHLFDILSDDSEKVTLSKFLSGLKSVGLRQSDPRLAQSMQKIRHFQKAEMDGREMALDKETFKECIKDNIVLIKRAFTADFIVPEFVKFCSLIDQIYWNCRTNTNGKVASYIPQLSRYSADYWGVSICTIDGQRHSRGEVNTPFSLQSTSKPLTYALAVTELGSNAVHDYVGLEPSGEVFNMIKLDQNNKPHNPMINAGAIVIASLVKNNLRLADRFDYITQQYRKLAGGEHLGFNNAIFLSERETASRNFALGYYMKENKCFPDGVNLMETMDFYFQLCSTEVTCESGAVMAATLANGGICPLTGEQVLNGAAVRNTLSLMHSCGMYDYSGQFAFKVGLPAKSGVSGVVMLVVPNVMGLCLWSPPLDVCGNSVRGIQFCEELIAKFNFHHYDNLLHTRRKTDPRRRRIDKTGQEVVSLLFGAYNGDVSALTRMALSGIDMRIADYDGRTALHLAAAEGHLEVVRFLLEKCKVPLLPQDRWGHTPLDDATRFKRSSIQQYLESYAASHPDEAHVTVPQHVQGNLVENVNYSDIDGRQSSSNGKGREEGERGRDGERSDEED